MKTKRPVPLLVVLALSAACAPIPVVRADDDPQIPAVSALRRVGTVYGDRHIGKIVRMRGKGGQPQPTEWWITVYDPSAPYLVHEFWVGDTRATDEGPNLDYYPIQTPPGFIPAENLKLDSVDAFEVLNEEARKAKIAFDSVNYFLRCREFSEEPVWTLQAIDPNGGCAGIIDLSAQTGKVLRTVWFYGEPDGGRRAARIVDSELLGRSRVDVLGTPGREGTGAPLTRTPVAPPDDPLTRSSERMVDPERLAPGTREIPLDEPDLRAPPPLPRIDPRPRDPGPVNPNVDTEVPEVIPIGPEE